MADFTQDIGGGASLMIREGPGHFQFRFYMKAGPHVSNPEQRWSFGVEYADGDIGSSTPRTFNLQTGGHWQYMGMIEDMGDLGPHFKIRLTVEDSGHGWPKYDFWHDFTRGNTDIPPPPVQPFIHDVGSNHVTIGWGGDGGVGGASITDRAFWWSQDGFNLNLIDNDGALYTLTGLHQGTRYYFWAKNANAYGWSEWSGRSEVVTKRYPDSPHPVAFLSFTQTSVRTRFEFTNRWDGGSPVLEWQIGYGLIPNEPQFFRTGVEEDIDGLQPGKMYYFWARARNVFGWSHWSGRTELLLNAGAQAISGGSYKRALPYVKHEGTWRLAQPWIKHGGIWRKASS